MLSTESERIYLKIGLKYQKDLYCRVNSIIGWLLYKLIRKFVALLCKYNFRQQSATYQQWYSNNRRDRLIKFASYFPNPTKVFHFKVFTSNQFHQLYLSDEAIFRSKFPFFNHGRTNRICKKGLPTKIRQCAPPFHSVKMLQQLLFEQRRLRIETQRRQKT